MNVSIKTDFKVTESEDVDCNKLA